MMSRLVDSTDNVREVVLEGRTELERNWLCSVSFSATAFSFAATRLAEVNALPSAAITLSVDVWRWPEV